MAAQSDRAMSSDDESSFEDIDHFDSSSSSDGSFELIDDAVSPKPAVASTEGIEQESAAEPAAAAAEEQQTDPSAKWHSLQLHPLGIDPSQPLGLTLLRPPRAGDAPAPPIAEIAQHHLYLLMHARQCGEQGTQYACRLPHCSTMCEVLQHQETCTNGSGCFYAHCASSHRLLAHWRDCHQRADCAICRPLLAEFGEAAPSDEPLVLSSASPAETAEKAPQLAVAKYWPFACLQQLRCDGAHPLGLVTTGYPVIKDFCPETSEVAQHHLYLILHARQCELKKSSTPCPLPHCATMKNSLYHVRSCTFGRLCQYAHCASTRELAAHWKNCSGNCEVCQPLWKEDFSVIYASPSERAKAAAIAPVSTVQPEEPLQTTQAVVATPVSEEQQNQGKSAQSIVAGHVDNPKMRKLIQQQLLLLIHAERCTKTSSECPQPHCAFMKDVRLHMEQCYVGRLCAYDYCSSSRQILQHWSSCDWAECPACLPVRNYQAHAPKTEMTAATESEAPITPAESLEDSPVAGEEANERESKMDETYVINNVTAERRESEADFETRLKDSETIKSLTAKVKRLEKIINERKESEEILNSDAQTRDQAIDDEPGEAGEQQPRELSSKKEQNRASFAKFFGRLEKRAERHQWLQAFTFFITMLHMLLTLAGSHVVFRCVSLLVSMFGFALNADLGVRDTNRVLAFTAIAGLDTLALTVALTSKSEFPLTLIALANAALCAHYAWSARREADDLNARIVRLAKLAAGIEEMGAVTAPSATEEAAQDASIRVVKMPTNKLGAVLDQLENKPAMITEIIPNGFAETSGLLRRGDEIISVDGIDVLSMSAIQVLALIKERVGNFELSVRYSEESLKEMEKRYDEFFAKFE